MKGLIVLAIAGALAVSLVVPAMLGAQSSTVEVPTWKTGDLWELRWEDEFQQKRSGTIRRTVTKVDELFEGQKVYWVSRGDGTFSLYTADNLFPIATVDAAGSVRSRVTRKGEKMFPLTAGRTYTFEFDTPAGQYRGTYTHTVAGIEELQVPAGTFQVFHVTEQGKGTFYNGRPFTEKGDMYFAPAVKNWVKNAYSVDTGYRYSSELVRYQVRE